MTRYRLSPRASHIECVHCGLPWTQAWYREGAPLWTLSECRACKAVITLLDWHPDGLRVLEANP